MHIILTVQQVSSFLKRAMTKWEKEMATHSRVLAWRIPGTVEPDGLLYMGLQRIQLKQLSSSSMTNDLDCPLVFKKLLYSE